MVIMQTHNIKKGHALTMKKSRVKEHKKKKKYESDEYVCMYRVKYDDKKNRVRSWSLSEVGVKLLRAGKLKGK